MNTERVEAAAKELCDLLESIDERRLLALDSDPHPPSAISVSVGVLRAALAAADAASGEKVVYTATESTLFAKVFQGAPAGSSFFVQPGEELVVRKVRTV